MSRVCEVCGKSVHAGGSISRRGLAKKKGGVGSRVIARNKRIFRPNLKKVRAWVNGGVQRVTACTSCIQAGKVIKPPKREYTKAE
ncbi:MAG: 50S ribosomal protein L28 [Planctomycetes bacterium]|mgnify:CR=1 FL=1|nr:50S ribosomal protein L28 [Planctomycetota bacterium]